MDNTDNTNNENNNPKDDAADATENVVNIDDAALENAINEGAANLSADDLVSQLQEELLVARDRTMRALADAENTRKRAMKDRTDAGKYAVANFARDMVAFGDNFTRALEAMPEDAPAAVREGLDAMQKELLQTFDRHGIKKIEPLDEPFDANFHEVMFEAPMPGKAGGIIIQVIEPGYVLNDRLLRAAKVGIAKADDGGPAPTDPGAQIDEQA